ncbi:hypothetical protein TNCV_260581 [Trichonephila clavipes]|nr:hypothetical protein TNCV_260581 [Trichonephila clavipes]
MIENDFTTLTPAKVIAIFVDHHHHFEFDSMASLPPPGYSKLFLFESPGNHNNERDLFLNQHEEEVQRQIIPL